jgi:hypothetical protein
LIYPSKHKRFVVTDPSALSFADFSERIGLFSAADRESHNSDMPTILPGASLLVVLSEEAISETECALNVDST